MEPNRRSGRSLGSRLGDIARQNWRLGAGLVVIAACLIVLAYQNRGAPSQRPGPIALPTSPSVAWPVPTPQPADITRTYPLAGGQSVEDALPRPWQSSLQSHGGAAYAGHLTLNAPPIAPGPSQGDAYRLMGAATVLARLHAIAAALAITGPVRHVRVGADEWTYIEDRTATAMHSIAVDDTTGALVYHNLRIQAGPPAPGGPPTLAQIRAARSWLERAGWLGMVMPVRAPIGIFEQSTLSVVRFNWPGLTADVPAASLIVDRSGVTREALLEPQVQSGKAVPLRSRQLAWDVLRQSGGPVGVEGLTGLPPRAGVATYKQVSLEYILTHDAAGSGYLVPAYRFSGTAAIDGVPSAKPWYALVPAVD